MTTSEGTITGRFVNVCGQIGVTQKASTVGKTIGLAAVQLDTEHAALTELMFSG